jgi:hypothetical protein
MWLQIPQTLEHVLWEGALEPATEEAVEWVGQEWAVRGVNGNVHDAVRDLPLASIGRPEVWALPEVYPPDKMPHPLRAKLGEADFYLVRLACSFRPRKEQSRVEWARFIVHLLPDGAARQLVAFDLHPLMVTQEVRRNVKVTLSPSLKFQEIGTEIGRVEFGFEYPELQPLISAAGAGEEKPSWDYEEARGVALKGSKWMHLLVKAPKGMETIRAILDLAADVQVRDSRLPVLAIRDRQQARDRLAVRLV